MSWIPAACGFTRCISPVLLRSVVLHVLSPASSYYLHLVFVLSFLFFAGSTPPCFPMVFLPVCVYAVVCRRLRCFSSVAAPRYRLLPLAVALREFLCDSPWLHPFCLLPCSGLRCLSFRGFVSAPRHVSVPPSLVLSVFRSSWFLCCCCDRCLRLVLLWLLC